MKLEDVKHGTNTKKIERFKSRYHEKNNGAMYLFSANGDDGNTLSITHIRN
jgi:hypothetical protein